MSLVLPWDEGTITLFLIILPVFTDQVANAKKGGNQYQQHADTLSEGIAPVKSGLKCKKNHRSHWVKGLSWKNNTFGKSSPV